MPGLTGHLLLLQFLERSLVLRDNVHLRSELGAFGVHHGFRSTRNELLVRELLFDAGGECLGLLDLHFVPNASPGPRGHL